MYNSIDDKTLINTVNSHTRMEDALKVKISQSVLVGDKNALNNETHEKEINNADVNLQKT